MNNIEEITLYAKSFYESDNSGHGFDHIERVLDYAKKIYDKESGDWNIIFLSVLFHDIHRMMSNEKSRYVTPKESLDKVRNILLTININKEETDKILYNIEHHEEKEIQSNNLELTILKEADILDSLGEVGLNRCLKYCKDKNIPVVNYDYSLDCEEYIPDVHPISTCHYIYRTMIPNANFINTEIGKELAKTNTKVLKDFLIKYYNNINF